MRFHSAHILRLAAVFMIISSVAAQAQDWPDILKPKQLFSVIVKGESASGTTLPPVKGTAWAVAPGVLITADHVTGKALNYKNASPSDKVFIPRRFVAVEVSPHKKYQGVKPLIFNDGIVTPSPFESIDAARIGFPDLEAAPFSLSACDIEPLINYQVLKFNNGDVFEPIPIAVSLKAYGRSKLGDAGSVVVMTGKKGAIKEGDSGSPVLDPTNQRVIGLVSAINDDSGSAVDNEVHVTLVKSFLDLIPFQIGDREFLDIPCSERIRLGRVDELNGELDTAKKSLEALAAENSSLAGRIDALEERNETLIQQVNTLLWNQVRLADETERSANKTVKLPIDDNAQPWAKNTILWEVNKEMFLTPPDYEPLRPTVTRISSELGKPKWVLSGSVDANNDVAITFAYERTLSGPPYSPHMVFCLTPIVWSVPSGTPSEKDPSHRKFYEAIEGPFTAGSNPLSPFDLESGAPDLCEEVGHTAKDSGSQGSVSETKGSYKWTRSRGLVGGLLRNVKRQFPGSNWDGTYYLQIFEPLPESDGGPMSYRLHTRAFVDVIREAGNSNEGSALPCKIFKDFRDLTYAVADSAEELPEENECG